MDDIKHKIKVKVKAALTEGRGKSGAGDVSLFPWQEACYSLLHHL